MDESSSRNPDREIVQGLRESSCYALYRLERRYRDRLYDHALARLMDRDEATSIVSDTLLQIVNSLDSFDFKNSDNDFRNWIFRICNRKIIDAARRRKREPEQATLISLDLEAEDEKGESHNPVQLEVNRQTTEEYYRESVENSDTLKKETKQFIQSLNPKDKIILSSCLDEVPHKEVAEYVEMTPNNVKVRFHRIKERFIQRLHQKGA